MGFYNNNKKLLVGWAYTAFYDQWLVDLRSIYQHQTHVNQIQGQTPAKHST